MKYELTKWYEKNRQKLDKKGAGNRGEKGMEMSS
jgi:hypothetical protein